MQRKLTHSSVLIGAAVTVFNIALLAGLPDSSVWLALALTIVGAGIGAINLVGFFQLLPAATRPESKVLRDLMIIALITVPGTFAMAYYAIHAFGTGHLTNYDGGIFGALYFSYVTLTTLGYGDMVPVGGCRAFAAVEAVMGLSMFGFLISLISAKLLESKNEVE